MRAGLIADLRRIVGDSGVSADPTQIERFSGDALGIFRAFRAAPRLNARPGAVVWPASTDQVSRVLRFANRQHVPVVPYGGGTGVMGGATSEEDCILLNLQWMCLVAHVSREDLATRVQSGALLDDVAAALKQEGLVLGHDPWSRSIATIGGAISTDGVGYTAAAHGSMGDQVLGLEVVLADGEILRTKDVPKAASGPSLNRLFIGSEGTLGIITEATIRAFPCPERLLLRPIEFPDFESGFAAVARLYAEGVRPTMVDYGEERWDGEMDDPAALYLAFAGFEDDVRTQDARAREVCRGLGGREGDQGEVERFWKTRHASGERYRREVLESDNPGDARRRRSSYRMDYLHVAMPVSRVLEYRRKCQKILASRRVLVREWSLWARPEFLSFLIVEEDDLGGETSESMAETVDAVLGLAQSMGGSMEYCHGVGLKLGHLMEAEMGAGIGVVRRLKRALDPNGILNPGKLAG